MSRVNFVQKRMVDFGPFMDRRYVSSAFNHVRVMLNVSPTSGLQNFATGHSTTNERKEKVS